MSVTPEILSGMADSSGSGLTAVATVASGTPTVIHTIPEGETHMIEIQVSNRDDTNAIVVVLDLGATANAIRLSIPVESHVKIGPFALSNTTLEISAVADEDEVGVSGIAWAQQ